MCVYAHIHVGECVCVPVCPWRPEDNLGYCTSGTVYLLVVVVYLFVFVFLDRTLIETQGSPNLNQLGRLAR